MQQQDRSMVIWLSAVNGIGAQSLKKIIDYCQHTQVSLSELEFDRHHVWEKMGLKKPQLSAISAFQKEFSPAAFQEFLAEKNISTVCWDEENYPDLLREIPDYPVVLYVRGPTNFWRILPVAVVGTRHLTPYGEQVTRVITRELVESGATIISGFMYGADLESHVTAMKECGQSVGVLGYGFHYLPIASDTYPTEEFLAAGNTFISEFSPFCPGSKANFPMRNRIVAGMSLATVVIEAGQKSGSLITAQKAVDYGRLVCTVPGPFTSIYSEGTKNLINDGAKCITSGYELVAELQPSLTISMQTAKEEAVKKHHQRLQQSTKMLKPRQRQIMSLLHLQGASTEELATSLGLEIVVMMREVSKLELAGYIKKLGNQWWPC